MTNHTPEHAQDQVSATQQTNANKRQDGITGDIGVCMSGGGYRAACFHLGTLDYLHRLELTDQINALSTVSGGTFTGTKYVLSLGEEKPFKAFFSEFYESLNMTNLIADGLKELAAKQHKVPSGRQDLIVSIAQVYSQTIFCKPSNETQNKHDQDVSRPYYFADILNASHSIDNVIINATDFRSGLAFRFQKTQSYKGKIGNFYNNIQVEDAAKIRLADIVAASSCFPGGFEPMSFPYDFIWQDDLIPDRVKRAFPFVRNNDNPANVSAPVALMDGGVFDNQGLQSLLLSEKNDQGGLDLVVISDVDQPSISLYSMPTPGSNEGLSLNAIGNCAKLFVFLCAVTLATIGIHAISDWHEQTWSWLRFVFLYAIPFCLTAIAAGTVVYLYKLIREDILSQIPLVGKKSWRYLRKLTLGQVRNMLNLRISSLLTLTSSVFMKRIRSLVYGLAYGQGSDPYKGKRVSNLIYSLAPSKTEKEPIAGIGKPSVKLSKIACVAFNQGTSLWFDKPYQQPSLVAAGQASLCYNMIKLIARRYGTEPDQYGPKITSMYNAILTDWKQFNDDPFFILKSKALHEDWPAIEKEVMQVDCHWGMFESTTPSLSELG